MAIVATQVAAVQQLYVAYFGRPADPAGLDYWTNVVEANEGSTAAVSATFAASPEYIVTFFGKTNTQIVDQIYTNLFNRAADATGRAYWVDLLDKGTIKVDTIVAEVAAAAKTTDLEKVENKVAAATAFTTALDTPAEIAGYGNFDAIVKARDFIKGIGDDASLKTALEAKALAEAVAGVVKAGTPFALEAGIAAMRAADKAVEKFVDANDLTTTGLTNQTAEVKTFVTKAEAALNGATGLDGGYVGTAGQKAAVLADEQKLRSDAAKEANTALATARAEADSTVVAAADTLVRANAAQEQAAAVELQAGLALAAAVTFLNAQNSTKGAAALATATDADTGVVVSTGVTFTPTGGTSTPLIRVDAETGVVTLAAGVTEAAYPGITALATAVRADVESSLILRGAVTAADDAADVVANLPTADKADATEIADLTATAAEKQADVATLAKLVADLNAAKGLVTEFAALTKAVGVAEADFAAAGYLTPEALDADAPFVAALTGSDVFTLGTADKVTLTNFGNSGDDVIFVGKNFTLNADGVDAGVDTAMEVFFVQNGNRAEVHVEKAAYGSGTDDVIVISLVGVEATDLQLVDGVISLKDGAA